MVKRLLIAEDDAKIRHLLLRLLEREGYEVMELAEGGAVAETVRDQKPDLLILDLNLPGLSGKDICLQLRQDVLTRALPILILTGERGVGLSVQCLDGGADDYLQKPFDLPEFHARVRALLRRPNLLTQDNPVISVGKMTLDAEKHRVVYEGRPVPGLAPKEFEVLRQVLLAFPRFVDKKTLALKVWGKDLADLHERTVDVHVRRIRKKLGPQRAGHFQTLSSIGYQWRVRASE